MGVLTVGYFVEWLFCGSFAVWVGGWGLFWVCVICMIWLCGCCVEVGLLGWILLWLDFVGDCVLVFGGLWSDLAMRIVACDICCRLRWFWCVCWSVNIPGVAFVWLVGLAFCLVLGDFVWRGFGCYGVFSAIGCFGDLALA